MAAPGPAQEQKHVACSRCRERKVKCDGGRPSCRRCQRNGHFCQYVKGKKQQVKNEWVRHLRTFSSQPEKKKGTQPSRLHSSHEKPLYPQGPSLDDRLIIHDSSRPGSRSPSPYLVGSTEASLNNYTNYGVSLSSAGSFDEPNLNVQPFTAMHNKAPNSQMYPFNSTPMYDNTFYSSNFLDANRSTQTYSSMDNSMRPHTPASQASDATSFDDIITPHLSYAFTSLPPITAVNTNWNQQYPTPRNNHSYYYTGNYYS